MYHLEPKARLVEICRSLHARGWASGTGGGASFRESGKTYLAPTAVPKEWLRPEDVFVLNASGQQVEGPTGQRLSACAPLFDQVYDVRNAGAVLHSHSLNAVMVTLLFGDVFRSKRLEMHKGIAGHGFYDDVVVPIVENTAEEAQLAGSLRQAMVMHPQSHAVLVRRHGVYIWGTDWLEAKKHAECYDYLFEAALKMAQLGLTHEWRSEPARQGDAVSDESRDGVAARSQARHQLCELSAPDLVS